ncbi:uncharacterized protein [Diadema setosum]|uniref:uncharacterized protein n=1 Tax=Diadema setosum TaxID=31175 RepID=UPI003B3BD197
MRSSADKSSLPLHDIKRQKGEDVIDAQKEAYMDMSRTAQKEKTEDVTFAESTDIDQDGYLLSRAAGDCSGSRNILSPIYDDIPTTSDQTFTFLEPHYVNEVLNVGKTDTHKPLALSANDPLYSVSIYSSKPNEKPEVDEDGYLVLEANAGEIIDDQFATTDCLPASQIPLYENEISPGADIHKVNVHANPPMYESISSNPEL